MNKRQKKKNKKNSSRLNLFIMEQINLTQNWCQMAVHITKSLRGYGHRPPKAIGTGKNSASQKDST